MHSLRINFVYNTEREYVYSQDEGEAAAADYEIIKTALNEHRRFKNDSPEIVEISGGKHGKATLKLEQVAAVSLTDLDSSKDLQAECASHIGRMEAIRDKAKAAEAATSS